LLRFRRCLIVIFAANRLLLRQSVIPRAPKKQRLNPISELLKTGLHNLRQKGIQIAQTLDLTPTMQLASQLHWELD